MCTLVFWIKCTDYRLWWIAAQLAFCLVPAQTTDCGRSPHCHFPVLGFAWIDTRFCLVAMEQTDVPMGHSSEREDQLEPDYESSDASEHDPTGLPSPMQVDPVKNYASLTHNELQNLLIGQVLPRDTEEANEYCFDFHSWFELGDPHVHFNAPPGKPYSESGEVGCPNWADLFAFVLDRCSGLAEVQTVYVLVDDRDLSCEVTQDDSLRHWPAVAAWWKSRLVMLGPTNESCDLVFFPLCNKSGLSNIHPTWAGTFVLAALCLVFPQKHFILLDSDCVPVTLFETADLWKEAHLVRVSGHPCEGTTGAYAGDPEDVRNLANIDDVPPVGQGVLLVTEHNAEVNAGFIVLFGSSHAPVVTAREIAAIPLIKGSKRDLAIQALQPRLVEAYWQRVIEMVGNDRDEGDMSAEECQAWVQSGLALTPFCGYRMNSTLDWAIAWSLIGEYTCRELFPPPKGAWPRCCQPSRLLSPYDRRSTPMHTWARASFEQGSLPSLLSLPGDAAFMILPGDRMFQAQRIIPGLCRPVILHGYGGAKLQMAEGLTTLAGSGWRPLASAMVGTQTLPPMWTCEDWRPIVGTSIDCRLRPTPLTEREELLLLSMWLRDSKDNLSLFHSANTWLSRKQDLLDQASPDRADSPHSPRSNAALEWSRASWFKPLFETYPPERQVETMLILRVMADTMSTTRLQQLTSVLLSGTAPPSFNRREWITVVRDSLDQTPMAVHTRAHLMLVEQLVKETGHTLSVTTSAGHVIPFLEIPSWTRDTTPLPFEWLAVLVLPGDEGRIHPLPQTVNIDCTGLGGHDLGGPDSYHICIRSDKHSQGVYGPSVAALEGTRFDYRSRKTIVALGKTKAMHEFLVLHYSAMDSAKGWDSFLSKCLPHGDWVRSDVRRATLMNMFDECHVPPSHRRPAHQSWAASLLLMLDLVVGGGKARYLRSGPCSSSSGECEG